MVALCVSTYFQGGANVARCILRVTGVSRGMTVVQSNLDLVTVNLVTILDLVTFFRKTDFLCSKNSRFSDILENSRTLI